MRQCCPRSCSDLFFFVLAGQKLETTRAEQIANQGFTLREELRDGFDLG